MKFTPNGGSSASSIGPSVAAVWISPGYMACAPARATAIGSAGETDTPPIGASWIGASQRNRSVSATALRSYALQQPPSR